MPPMIDPARSLKRLPKQDDARDWTWNVEGIDGDGQNLRGAARPEAPAGAVEQLVPQIPLSGWGHANTYEGRGWMMNGNGPVMPGENVPPDWTYVLEGGCGDCVDASQVNESKVLLTDSHTLTPIQALAEVGSAVTAIKYLYSPLTGFDPVTGANDNGTEIRARLRFMAKTGIPGLVSGHQHKTAAYFAVDPKNPQHLAEVMYFAEAVPIGMTVREAHMQAFYEGERTGRFPIIWDAAPDSPIVGLHCFPLLGRPDTKHWAAANWTRRILLTNAFIEQEVDEAWGYVSVDRISKVTGKDWVGASPAQLEEYFRLLAKAWQP